MTVHSGGFRLTVLVLFGLLLSLCSSGAAGGIVINELGRDSSRVFLKITFVDESGFGIQRYLVQTSSDPALVEGPAVPASCPRIETVEAIEIPTGEVVGAYMAACTTSGEEPEGWASITSIDTHAPIDWGDAEENPCTVPPSVLDESGSTCSGNWQRLDMVIDGIAASCAEIQRLQDLIPILQTELDSARTHAIAGLVMVAIALIVAANVPWPANLGFVILAAVCLIAALFFGLRALDLQGEVDAARAALDSARISLEASRELYREIVDQALRACCGYIPEGVSLDPPACE